MKNIPKKIYLNTQFDPDLINHLKESGKSLSDILLEEATWSPDKRHETDIEYILASESIPLSSRDEIASRALQGLIANCYYQSGISRESHIKESVLLADALIAELERKEETNNEKRDKI